MENENDENDEGRPVKADGDFHPFLLSNVATALSQAHLPRQMETWKDGISLHGSTSYSSIQNELSRHFAAWAEKEEKITFTRMWK